MEKPKKLDFTRYTNGSDTFNYFENDGKMYEISSVDATVRVMSMEACDKLVIFYHNNDESEYDIETVKYEIVDEKESDDDDEDKDHEDYYLFNTPYNLLK